MHSNMKSTILVSRRKQAISHLSYEPQPDSADRVAQQGRKTTGGSCQPERGQEAEMVKEMSIMGQKLASRNALLRWPRRRPRSWQGDLSNSIRISEILLRAQSCPLRCTKPKTKNKFSNLIRIHFRLNTALRKSRCETSKPKMA